MIRLRQLALGVLALAVVGCVPSRSGPEPRSLEDAAQYNTQLGFNYLRAGNLSEAKVKIERALEQNPRHAMAHVAAGLLYDQLGEARKADVHFSRAVALEGDNPEILNNYAVFLCRNEQAEKGQRYFLKAATNPLYRTPEAAYFNAGTCARSGGDLEQAEQHFRRALDIRPDFPGPLLQMADIEYRSQRFLSARAFLERFLAASAANPDALWLGVRIERALGNAALADQYAQQLKREFPMSVQTRELLESERNTG